MPQASQAPSRLSWATDIIFLITILALFYFLWLGDYPLFTPDEGRYSEVAREMLASGDFVTPRVNGVAFLDKPVLYYWLQAAAMHCFGVTEWAVRFFPAIYGIHGCIAVYLAGRRLFSRRTGILSALILATAPLYFIGSHYANLDLEVAVLITTSLLAFLVACNTQGKMRTVVFAVAYIFAGCAFLTKGLIAIAFPAMIAGLWIMMLSRWRLLTNMRLPLGIIIIAAIVIPWFVMVQRANPAFLHFFFVTQQVERFLSAAEFNNPSPPWFYLPVILAGFLPWTAFVFQALGQQIKHCWQARQEHASELYLLIWVAVIFGFFSIPHSKVISYILPILPALALITGKYLADAWESNATSLKLGRCLLILLNTALAVLLFILPSLWADLAFELFPTLCIASIIVGGTALLALTLNRYLRTPQLFFICAISSALMLLTFAHGAKHLNSNSAKPLIEQLQPILQPSDTVVNYFKFYQDVPIYLGRTIILVADWQSPTIAQRDNWVRELWYSMPFQNTDEILLTEDSFWKRWHSKEKIYVFVNQNYFAQFQSHTRQYHLIKQHRDILLLTNQR